MKKKAASYMLRRVLPLWKPEEAIEEVLSFCRRNHVDEVMWKDESSGSFHELLTIPEVKDRAKLLQMAADRLKGTGIKHSINVLTSIGHGDYCYDVMERHPGIEVFVDYYGVRSRGCACPMSPVWRKIISETYRIYAMTKPVRIWVEDDFRLFNHGPASLGCCCDRHLSEFGRLIGKKISREELTKAVLKPGEPHPWRKPWLRFQEECMLEVARMIREAVHSASPSSQLGLMVAQAPLFEAQGVGINALMKAFGGKEGAAIRIHLTSFSEGNPRMMLPADESLKGMIPRMPENTVLCTEVENCPHSLYSKSAYASYSQMVWGCVLNVPNQTLNLFDYIGTPMDVDPNMADMLKNGRKVLDSISGEFCADPVFRGVGLLSHEYSADNTHASEGAKAWEMMARESEWADVLRAFGFPIVYSFSEEVTAVSGQAFRSMPKEDIRKVFSRGVLLDLAALKVLHEMGLGDLAGVEIEKEITARTIPMGSELLTDPDFGGAKHRLTWGGVTCVSKKIGVLKPAKGARVISQILDPDLKPMFPGAIIHENTLGGRVAVYPEDFSSVFTADPCRKGTAPHFYSEYRRIQMQAVIKWLGKGKVPMMVRANGWILPHRSDMKDKVALAVMNINTDNWKTIKIEACVQSRVKRVKVMDRKGVWKLLSKGWKQNKDKFEMEVKADLPLYGLFAAVLELR